MNKLSSALLINFSIKAKKLNYNSFKASLIGNKKFGTKKIPPVLNARGIKL